jgi:hypothetical protein
LQMPVLNVLPAGPSCAAIMSSRSHAGCSP